MERVLNHFTTYFTQVGEKLIDQRGTAAGTSCLGAFATDDPVRLNG